MSIKISIIITTFNRESYLSETLNAITNQTYRDFEVIIVDNFSNYNIHGLIKSFNDGRIKLIQNNNEGIIAINRNIGLRNAKYNIIAFCDDDDIWHKDKLRKQIEYINQNNLDKNFVIYSNCNNFTEDSNSLTNKEKIYDLRSLFKSNPISFSTTIMSKPELEFNEEETMVAVEDYLFWCELICNKFKFYLIKDNLVNYRVLQSSASYEKFGVNHLKAIHVIIHILIKYNSTHLNIKNIVSLLYSCIINISKLLIKNILRR